jgi:hypothetical protein
VVRAQARESGGSWTGALMSRWKPDLIRISFARFVSALGWLRLSNSSLGHFLLVRFAAHEQELRVLMPPAAIVPVVVIIEVEHVEQIADRRHIHGHVWIGAIHLGIG